MNTKMILSFMIVSFLWADLAISQTCDSCGKECQSACGTRGFRTCCLNYLKKRSEFLSMDSETRSPFLKSFYETPGSTGFLRPYYPYPMNFLLPEAKDVSSTEKIFAGKPHDKLKCLEND